ncbi:putative kinase protein [Nocardia nova SH22a]|uniref:Putative kinase protein n=1 Tax=Nocardia nova SH22a TaxID=1415166 RepID=W5TCE3_9NOCA|nr:hypothetical protein [Nocardia nova]AHH17020.1 putative kinase protein [Nocardia nova SH22a]
MPETVIGEFGGAYQVEDTPLNTSGGQSVLFRCRDRDDEERVYKRYNEPLTAPEAVTRLREVVERGRRVAASAEKLLPLSKPATFVNWPIDLVESGEHVVGVVLPWIPPQFLRDDGRPRTFDYLCLASADPPKSVFRVRVLRHLCRILQAVDDAGLVHGDISAKNIVWSEGRPHAYLIDCDGMRPADATDVRGVGTEGWRDPRWVAGRISAHDGFSDRFGLAVALYRGLFLNPGAPVLVRGDWHPPTGIPAGLAPRLRALFDRAFAEPFTTEDRPSPAEWGRALTAVHFTRIGGFRRRRPLAVLERHAGQYRDEIADGPQRSEPLPPEAEFQRWHDQLGYRHSVWSAGGARNARLLTGAELRDARRWQRRHRDRMSAAENAFIKRSTLYTRRRALIVAMVLIIAQTAELIAYHHRGDQVSQIAAADLSDKAARLRRTDPYGALQLDLRAHRTNRSAALPAVYTADRYVPDYLYARQDSSPPQPTASSAPSSPPAADPLDLGQLTLLYQTQTMSRSISADGSKLATVDGNSTTVVRSISEGSVESESLTKIFGPTDATVSEPVLSRDGRYVVVLQSVFGNPKVDRNGKMTFDYAAQPTCKPPKDVMSARCLAVYDTTTHKVAYAARLDVPGPADGYVAVGMDPTNRFVGLSVSTASGNSFDDTLYLYDLRNKGAPRKVDLPFHTLVTNVWLGAAAATAVVSGLTVRESGPGFDGVLRWSDLNSGRSEEMAGGIDGASPAAMSLDGRVAAALVPTSDPHRATLTTWNTDTGALRARYPVAVDGAQRLLALDRDGATAWLSYLPANQPRLPDAATADDLLAWHPPANQVTVYDLADGNTLAQGRFGGGWTSLVPLGAGPGASLLAVDGSLLGIELSGVGGDSPLRRLGAALTPRAPDRSALCERMADVDADRATRDLWPPGAYRGPACR